MRQIKHAVTRFALRSEKQILHVQRLALAPRFEGGRGQYVIELHRQIHAIFRWEERIHRKRAEIFERRILRLKNQLGQFNILALTPGVLE